MQSHSTLPAGVCARIARCPMPNAGVVSIVVSPGARRRNLLLCALLSRSSVVQDWPDAGTNCRASVQIAHAPGGASLGAYWVPQAMQMKDIIGEEYIGVAVMATQGSGWPLVTEGGRRMRSSPHFICPRQRKRLRTGNSQQSRRSELDLGQAT